MPVALLLEKALFELKEAYDPTEPTNPKLPPFTQEALIARAKDALGLTGKRNVSSLLNRAVVKLKEQAAELESLQVSSEVETLAEKIFAIGHAMGFLEIGAEEAFQRAEQFITTRNERRAQK
jgi:hypothetical protein